VWREWAKRWSTGPSRLNPGGPRERLEEDCLSFFVRGKSLSCAEGLVNHSAQMMCGLLRSSGAIPNGLQSSARDRGGKLARIFKTSRPALTMQTRTPSDSDLVVLIVRAGARDWRALGVHSRIVI